MKPFFYSEHAPAASLTAHVLAYWRFDVRRPAGEQFLHHVWPDGCVSLTVVSAGDTVLAASVAGPGTEARRFVVEGGCSYRGIRLWPDAAHTALGIDPAALRDRSLPMHTVLGDHAQSLARAIATVEWTDAVLQIDSWLLAHLTLAPPDARVRGAIGMIGAQHGEIPVASLAANVGLGARQLQRRFRALVGLTPKEYARVRRMRSGIDAVLRGETHWAMLAASLGYADQSHLIRDFSGLTGLTPSDLESRLDRIEHEGVDP